MSLISRVSILIFSFFGIADSVYLATHTTSGSLPSCSVGGAIDGCRVVAESSYSYLFGIPISMYGVVFYAVVFTVASLSLFVLHAHVKKSLRFLSVIGAAGSVVFILIQVFLIGALCIYCLTSAVLTFLILISAWTTIRLKKRLTS